MKPRLFEAFDHCVLQWFEDFQAAGHNCRGVYPLSNRIILEAFDDEAPIIQWSEDLFLEWNRVRCGDLVATFEDGEAEYLVEEEMAQLVADLPRHELRCRISFLEQCLVHESVHARTHSSHDLGQGRRPVRIGVANKRERLRTQHSIWVAFEEQPAWQEALERAEWEVLPPRGDLPSVTLLLPIAHLFSGRRRSGDVHHFLNEWAMAANVTVTVLSLDTAVSSYYGNLCMESCSWKRILQLFEEGVISGAIAGSPCETFSAARNQPTPIPGLPLPRWPRPLRTARRPYGLAGLTGREYGQLKQGSAFFLQTTLLAVWQLVHGGLFLSEHPAPPPQLQYASIYGVLDWCGFWWSTRTFIYMCCNNGDGGRNRKNPLGSSLSVYLTSLVTSTAMRWSFAGATTRRGHRWGGVGCLSHFEAERVSPSPWGHNWCPTSNNAPSNRGMHRQSWLLGYVKTALESQRIVDRSFLPDYQGRWSAVQKLLFPCSKLGAWIGARWQPPLDRWNEMKWNFVSLKRQNEVRIGAKQN